MMSNAVVQALTNCQVHFALMGSDFDQEGKKKLTIERIHKYDRIFSLYGTLIFKQHTPFHTAYVIYVTTSLTFAYKFHGLYL